MSVFVVSMAHIDLLVNAALQLGILHTRSDADDAGTLLWNENYRSVNHRYGETNQAPRYLATIVTARFRPAAVAKAVNTYLYQISECPGWQSNDAYAWCMALRAAAESTMLADDLAPVMGSTGTPVPAYQRSSVYEKAPWFVESLDDVPLQDRPSPS
ncbi:hypothetical protein [Actinosynnema sp. NPDC023587]|uniref:hypothetical protein n=1 Tax=Actinosynnema sp. NPDC023587 TaxID=3154695 RepID=UPI00340C3CC3